MSKKKGPTQESFHSSHSEQFSKDSLLNPRASLLRNSGSRQRQQTFLSDDESDIETLFIPHQNESDVSRISEEFSRLSKDEKRQLMKQLQETIESDSDEELQEVQESDDSGQTNEENDEPQPSRVEPAENETLMNSMPFLRGIKGVTLESALLLIQRNDYSLETKLKYLKDVLPSRAFTKCEEFLQNERYDFLKYAPGAHAKSFAEKIMERKNYDDLKTVVAGWGEKAEAALNLWLGKLNPIPASAAASEKDRHVGRNAQIPLDTSHKKDKNAEQNINTKSEGGGLKKKAKKKKAVTRKERPTNLRNNIEKASSQRKTAKTNYEAINFTKNLFDRCPQTMNIIFMGGTGFGKSTLINNCVNLLSYSDLDDAEADDFPVLIPSTFVLVEREGATRHEISVKANVQVERLGDTDDNNESKEEGESATQAPKSYLFSWGPEDNKKYIRLIDTPGVGDTRGVPVDDRNFAKILDFITGFKEIHAICIVLKANEARNTLVFRYCQNQLFSHLDHSAARNIFFCFTNSSGHYYSPGDSYGSLQKALEKLEHKIELDGKYFCFDSESFRYLCCRKQGIAFREERKMTNQKSFAQSKRQIFNLLEAIVKVEPHSVGKTLDVNNVRRLIMVLLRPTAECTKAILATDRMINDQIQALKEAEKRGDDIRENMYIKRAQLYSRPLEYPRTVCTAHSCIETQTIDKISQTHYKKACHDHCYLHGVQTSLINNSALQECVALSGHIDKCSECGCPWNMHMHITYTIDSILIDVINTEKQAELNDIQDRKEYCEQAIKEYREQSLVLQREKNQLLEFLVEALAFSRKYSIVSVNDAFIEYLGHMISQESAKKQNGGDGTLLQELCDYRDQYEELVEQHSKLSTGAVKSIEDMYKMIEELKDMSQNGKLFKEVQDLELLRLKDQPNSDAKSVDLSKSWMGWVFTN